MLPPPFPQMQVQQLHQMKKQQAAVQAAAAQQKAVEPQQGPATVQQKVRLKGQTEPPQSTQPHTYLSVLLLLP